MRSARLIASTLALASLAVAIAPGTARSWPHSTLAGILVQ